MGKIIIVGAGFGGLSAAAYLAKAGHNVTVLEKNNQVGGRAMVFEKDGYTFDQGPSWYLMPDVFEEFFADFGTTPEEHYQLEQLTPSYKVFEHDENYDVHTAPQVYELFERLEPGSRQLVEKLLRQTKHEYQTIRSSLLAEPMQTVREALGSKEARSLLRKPELLRSYHSRILKYTLSEKAQHILEFMTVFLGGSPQNIPALYSLLTHVDLGQGVRYPMGGMGQVVRAVCRVAESQGATVKLSTPVRHINVHLGEVTGVTLDDGSVLSADSVVANADYHHVETALLPKAYRSYPQKYWNKRTLSPSGLLLFLGVDKTVPRLRHHNLFFDSDWDQHFREVFNTQTWSKDPLFYVCAPSKTDPSVAPRNAENLFVLAPIANGSQPNKQAIAETADRILARIEAQTGSSIRRHLRVFDARAHDYFSEAFNAYRGNAFGLAHTFTQSGPFRPRLQSKKVKGLYYVGQYTNPGTGVPLVILSGKAVSKVVG